MATYNLNFIKSNSSDIADKLALSDIGFLSDNITSVEIYDGLDNLYGDELQMQFIDFKQNNIDQQFLERFKKLKTIKGFESAIKSGNAAELIKNSDLKDDSEVIQKEVNKNKTDSEKTEKSEASENINTINESTSSTGPAQFQCSQGSSYNYTFSGSAEEYGKDVRYEGEFPLSKVIAKKRGGNPPVGWQPWANTLTYVINPAIRAGYFHKEIVVNSSYRSNGSSNHRYLGAIDFGYYGENKLEVLANLAYGIVALNLPFDKLLFESDERRYGENSGWIHVQVAKDRNNPARTVISCRDGGCTEGNRVSGINIDYVRRGNIAGID